MFTFGDALVIGFVLLFLVWLLKHLWPRKFEELSLPVSVREDNDR